ncbi:hypothetical protein [Cryptosporangium japonicum]|uniref:Uncharacterized protein n=1 Tax=Cryptosporangium japonicum TaxID=80872 RepID=A0ABP3D571_9ACTN
MRPGPGGDSLLAAGSGAAVTLALPDVAVAGDRTPTTVDSILGMVLSLLTS